jgi:hypothetical protein
MGQMAGAPLIEDGRVCYFAFVDFATLGYGNVAPRGISTITWTSPSTRKTMAIKVTIKQR